jgi:transcription termination/antitermination protein NusG
MAKTLTKTEAAKRKIAATHAAKAEAKADQAKADSKRGVVKKKAAAKPKSKLTQKAAREAETRLVWAPTAVEGAKWYVLQTASNYEKRVQSLLREQILLQNMQRFVEDVLIPTEPVVEVKKGIKVAAERKFFPGYVLIKCIMNDSVWHLIRHTPHVTAFMGADHGRKPLPISTAEAQRILNAMQNGAEKPKNLVAFEVGESVRVMDGPFANFQGMVDLVDDEKERLTVSVSIFGRATPIELDYNQVEKA